MFIFKKIADLQNHLSDSNKDKKVGFVPTMGALHNGHISLVQESILHNDLTIVSIFVNPTQFDKKEDLDNYPSTINSDLELLEKNNCDIVFLPSVSEMYGDNINSKSFDFDGLEHEMEGKFRDGHFDGVGTIVKKLLLAVNPDNAYFGEKDFQQLQIIKKLVEKEKMSIHIIGCPIYRELDGLAFSSRNIRLTDEQRKEAPLIYKTIREAKKRFEQYTIEEVNHWVANEFKKSQHLDLEYFTIADEKTLKTATTIEKNKAYRAFIAVFAGKVRLIDNIHI